MSEHDPKKSAPTDADDQAPATGQGNAVIDAELEEYRTLLEPPTTFESGFGWTAVIGALFCGLLMFPGAIYLGLLSGTRDDAIQSGAYKTFYMHRTSHWLGLDVHDAGTYHVDGKARPLEPGMVFTVEPGIYVPVREEKAPAQDAMCCRSWRARHHARGAAGLQGAAVHRTMRPARGRNATHDQHRCALRRHLAPGRQLLGKGRGACSLSARQRGDRTDQLRPGRQHGGAAHGRRPHAVHVARSARGR